MSDSLLGIALPPSWRRRSDPAHGVLVTARASALPASGVSPEITLHVSLTDEPLTDWRAQAMHDLAAALVGFELEDEDDFDLLGTPVAYRRFGHRLGSAEVVSDQWAWVGEGSQLGQGVTLTCTVAREDYGDYCDVFEAIAETVDVAQLAA